jgi:hypothetical protein
MPRMRTLLILSLVLVGCSDDKTNNTPPVDAAVTPDAPALLTLDCTTYCTHLASDCTGTSAQLSAANCMGACAAIPPGAATDTSGNTLGCRNYHLQNIEVRGMSATLHCPHAGPIGALAGDTAGTCGTSACDDWCAMQTKVCGTDAVPVAGVTNRYTDLAACKTACMGFTKTPEPNATITGGGNTFACRVYHLTNAAAQTAATGTNAHCGHTLVSVANPSNATTVGPCF